MCIMYMQELRSTEEATASSGIGLQAIVNSRQVLGTGTVSSTRAVSTLKLRHLSSLWRAHSKMQSSL